MQHFIANTDHAWFDFLSDRAAPGGRLDEANFWSPKSLKPMKTLAPGAPVFLRLKAPRSCIAGYGFFAHFDAIDIDLAWVLFWWKNGDPDKLRFLVRIGQYRGLDLLEPGAPRKPLGCTILRDVHFWPRERWIPWQGEMGWHGNIVRGKEEQEPELVAFLMEELRRDAAQRPVDLGDAFVPLDVDRRRIVEAAVVQRQGQGAFKARLMSAYEGRCAITGERTKVVLDAAHIQPYLGPESNHPQNGLLLTKEFHTLFDAGYVGVTPDLEVRVSPRLRADWGNGKRYEAFDGHRLVKVPQTAGAMPSRAALEWHWSVRFLGGL